MRPGMGSNTVTPHQSDAELVHRAKAGELSAVEELVTRYERRVYTLARRILQRDEDAEDVMQETFISVLEHLDGFRQEASFYTWLRRIATHAALKVLRKRKGWPFVTLEQAIEPDDGYDSVPHPEFIADWRENPESLLQNKETRRLLEGALNELDEKYRVVFLLRDVEELSVKETAEVLGISESNVKVRLLRARLQLRERLTRAFGDETTRVFRNHDHG